jgi:hypothetical protein
MTEQEKIARAVARAERFCSREKAIQLVAMNSRYSIAEVRAAVSPATR